MPRLLSKLRIRAIALVPKGANLDDETGDGAHIVVRKAENGTRNSGRQQTTVSAELVKVRQILIDHGLENSALHAYVCDLNRRAVLKGSVLDGAPVIDTTEVSRAKDQRQRRLTLMASRDRAIAKMRAGTAHSPGLSGEQADERFNRENPDWYPQYRATFD
jgi:hypothetical protein